MRKLIAETAALLVLGLPLPAQATTGASMSAVATIEHTSEVLPATTTGDVTCDTHEHSTAGKNAFGVTLWRFTVKLRLCWGSSQACPCVLYHRGPYRPRTRIEVYTNPLFLWSWDGIIERYHEWCDFHLCYYTERTGEFSLCVGPACSHSTPLVWIKGYACICTWLSGDR